MNLDGPGCRTVDLGGGRTLTVRPATLEDVDGLARLYAALSIDDRYRRFFSGYRPTQAFLERWVTQAERGGGTLVVVVSSPAAGPAARPHDEEATTEEATTEEIVADAGFALQDDGDGELALTVAPEWRGWLGPFLLDALVELAASAGVTNLQAEVLLENGPMLSLLRGRGAVTLDHPDVALVRVSIATEGRVAGWPPVRHGRRILVEARGGRWHAETAARSAGFEVMICPGPDARPRGHPCPVLEGRPCPLVQGADAVVVALPGGEAEVGPLVRGHRVVHPDEPVVVEGVGARGTAPPVRPPGVEAVPACSTGAALVEVLRRVVDEDDAT